MNSLFLAGEVTSEPVSKVTNAGQVSTTFRLTVRYREDIANTFTVTAFRGLAEHIADALRVGDRILLKGHLENGGVIADDIGASFRDGIPFEE